MKKLFTLLLTCALLVTFAAAETQSAVAWLLYTPITGWPENISPDGNDNIATKNAVVTGEGTYSISLTYLHPWTSTEGAQRLHIVVDNGQALFPGLYMNVTDVRVDGVSIPVGSIGYGPGYDNGIMDENDSYAVLYDQVFVNQNVGAAGHVTWDGSNLKASVINQEDIPYGGITLEVDFFLSSIQNELPGARPEVSYTWFSNNTAGVAGLSLKDLGIADDWHNIVPVDLTVEGVWSYPMVAADAHQIGTVHVIVTGGQAVVECEYFAGEIYEKSQCVKWFTSLDQLTAGDLASTEGGLSCGEAVSIADDLDGAEVAYLSVNNKVTFRSPVDYQGNFLPRYFRNKPDWKAYREQLMSLMPDTAE
ncbi:MAG: hypothetical protein IKK57_04210 [Clostridia bacterium]|nr:hypothetical protein [Clostridia bacterium]